MVGRKRSGGRRERDRLTARLRTQSGFSLVEIAISILVLGLGFASLLSVVTVGIKWSQDAMLSATGQFAAESWQAAKNRGDTIPSGSYTYTTKLGSLPFMESNNADEECQLGNTSRMFCCTTPNLIP